MSTKEENAIKGISSAKFSVEKTVGESTNLLLVLLATTSTAPLVDISRFPNSSVQQTTSSFIMMQLTSSRVSLEGA